jgi:hypothetical protein
MMSVNSDIPANGHDWFRPDFVSYDCCRNCGIVRRMDGQNKPCRGQIGISLRGYEKRVVNDEGS